jgi:hypothetical protein
VARDPSFSIAYADLKAGKTSDVLAAFPNAVFVAAPGALAPAINLWGFEPPQRNDLETFGDVRRFGEKMDSKHVALVVDDATLIADRTANYYFGKGLRGWDIWGAVLASAVKMRDSLRRRGFHIAFTCHPRSARVENGVRVRGGPSFQGQCALKIPAACDFLLRAEARPGAMTAATGSDLGIETGGVAGAGTEATQQFGWPMVYRLAWHPDWMQGSRYGTPDLAPMNLGEILRLAGFSIPRMKGLEWQDKVAAGLAQALWDGPGLGDAAYTRACFEQVKAGCLARFSQNEAHVYWAIRDGFDRAVLHVAAAGQRRAMWGV